MQITNPQRLALEVVAAALEPPPAIDYLAWAEANIAFDEGQFPGPYNRTAFPFWDEVLRALGPDDPCRFVTVTASAQVGKTALATIFALGTLAVSRGSFLFVHPTTDNAVRWSKMKLAPMMRSTPAVCTQFPQRTNDSLASVKKLREQWETYPPIGDPPPRRIAFTPSRLAR
jgi:phage terminase large subunit GpA-like protein